jgi:hypothetical protein
MPPFAKKNNHPEHPEPTTAAGWQAALSEIASETASYEQRRSELVAERASLPLRARFGSAAARTQIAVIDHELQELQPN